MEALSNLYGLIGPAGLVLILLALMVIYFAVKTAIIIRLTSKSFDKAAAVINSNSVDLDVVLSRNKDNPILAIVSEVIKTHGHHSDDIKAEVAYLFNLHFSKVMRDITLIRVIAAIAPMLGLLGTLLGLMGVFGSLATSANLATSTILAAGIWEAIITTVMGISLAIPSMIVYHILRLKMKTFHLATVEYSYRLYDRRQDQCPPSRNIAPMRKKEAVA